MRIATLNVQNLRLLSADGTAYLHGAWDSDDPDAGAYEGIDRRLTAQLLSEVDADVVALQEVFDHATLDHFHDAFLLPAGMKPYDQRICLPGNDGRGMNVAVLSRRPVEVLRSHAALRPRDLGLAAPPGVDPDLPIFRRDCLMARIDALTLFVCHFKSAFPDPRVAWQTRHLEAMATRRIIERAFADPARALWLVIGDLNEPETGATGAARAIAPLEEGFSVNLMERLAPADRWTYFDSQSGRYHCPDALLASPALAARFADALPVVFRKGLGRDSGRSGGQRYAGVGRNRPHASDHAAVGIDFQPL